jgi:hypothetical protein
MNGSGTVDCGLQFPLHIRINFAPSEVTQIDLGIPA